VKRRPSLLATILVVAALGCGGISHEGTPDWAATETTPLASSPGWVPIDCPEDFREEPPHGANAEYRAEIPYPEPATVGEVIEDFEHGYFGLFRTRPPKRDDPERPIYRALARGEVTFDVRQVTNWSTDRCGRTYRPHYFVVRLLDREGTEIGRGTVGPDGAIGGYGGGGPGRIPARILDPASAASLLRPFGVEAPRDAQLVGLDGLHGRCRRYNPCLVARAEGSIWVVIPGDARGSEGWVYEIQRTAERITPAEAAELRMRGSKGLADLCCSNWQQPLLSIGKAFAWATLQSGPHFEAGGVTPTVEAIPGP